ncbi:MAG: glycoside hydrolase family 3 N-terminal domain-containing protein [Ktedonobacteraceae bacterium]
MMSNFHRCARTRYLVLIFCLVYILSACALLPNNSNGVNPSPQPSATHSVVMGVSPLPTSAPLSDSQLAAHIVYNMTLDQKLGQMVIVEFYGATRNSDLQQMLQGNQVSGVLIENKNGNAQSRSQLIALNRAMQSTAHIPLFITTDFEGGYINELRQITGERIAEQQIGATGDPKVAYNAGHSAAVDLTALGLNVNFMPIVDVLTNPNNPGLPERTFGSNPQLVTNMGRAYLKGLTDGGIIGCLKHFPGLGSANIDPHKSLPSMDRSLATLNAVDLVPYRTLINEGVVPMVMVTHILNPQLDPRLPTSLSPHVVTDMLRKQLNFNGVIISDTLWMGGISNTYNLAQAAVLAVRAGTDLLLGPRGLADTQHMIYGLHQAVTSGQISQAQIDASVTRMLTLKMRYKIISHAQALQLAHAPVNGESMTKITCSCGDYALSTGGEDVDVRQQFS